MNFVRIMNEATARGDKVHKGARKRLEASCLGGAFHPRARCTRLSSLPDRFPAIHHNGFAAPVCSGSGCECVYA